MGVGRRDAPLVTGIEKSRAGSPRWVWVFGCPTGWLLKLPLPQIGRGCNLVQGGGSPEKTMGASITGEGGSAQLRTCSLWKKRYGRDLMTFTSPPPPPKNRLLPILAKLWLLSESLLQK